MSKLNTCGEIKKTASISKAQNHVPTLLDQIRTKLNLSVSFLLLRGSTKQSGKKSMTRSTRRKPRDSEVQKSDGPR